MGSLRIALTQRVALMAEHGEVRDCLDQRWCAFLQALEMVPIPIPNGLEDPVALVEALEPGGILLTGGNNPGAIQGADDVSPERDRTEAALLVAASERRLPVIGVCRGMQMICSHWGASLSPVSGHVGVRHEIHPRNPGETGGLWPAPLEVNSYHGYGCLAENLPAELESLAEDAGGVVEAVRHRLLPLYGIMWHPEREASFSRSDLVLFERVFRQGRSPFMPGDHIE